MLRADTDAYHYLSSPLVILPDLHLVLIGYVVFAMFASVRRTCLEHQSRAATILQVSVYSDLSIRLLKAYICSY